MNCLIENEYMQGKKRKNHGKHILVFTNEFAWLKTNTKGKKTEKNGKNKLAYFITGGGINAMWTLPIENGDFP